MTDSETLNPLAVPHTKAPFFIKLALIERFIQSRSPMTEPGLPVIVATLRRDGDMLRHFVSRLPGPEWAHIFFNQGFLTHAPTPSMEAPEPLLSPWYAQWYLCSIADKVPELLVRHIVEFEGDVNYMVSAIHAVPNIPLDLAESVLPQICRWLDIPESSLLVFDAAYQLMLHFARHGRACTFVLLRALTKPFPSPHLKETNWAEDMEELDSSVGRMWVNAEAVSELRTLWHDDDAMREGIDPLLGLDMELTAQILEDQLRLAIQIESESLHQPTFHRHSRWRNAIEDTNQDILEHYKELLLKSLRYALEEFAQRKPASLEPWLRRYLRDQTHILRRLALHLLHKFPATYATLVADELLSVDNLSDIGIQHEFFLLIREGFLHLPLSDQTRFLTSILDGPTEPYRTRLQEWAKSDSSRPGDEEHHFAQYVGIWQRDRLQMLQEHLQDGTHAEALHRWREVSGTIGKAEHPEFTSYMSGAFFVQDISSLSDEDLDRMSPAELLRYLENWQPDGKANFGPEQITHRGMATALGRLVKGDPLKYQDYLYNIGKLRPEYAAAIVNIGLRVPRPGENNKNSDDISPISNDNLWKLRLSLGESLLGDENIASNMEREFISGWAATRGTLVDMLHHGLETAISGDDDSVPLNYLSRIKRLLLQCVNDPDPSPADDRPPKGWSGHNDPLHIAINHVRSCALMALIDYAHLRAKIENVVSASMSNTPADDAGEKGPNRLESDVEAVLTQKLDRQLDPSWGVHATYGRQLDTLYRLNRDWITEHAMDIFPSGDDQRAQEYFIAAWESYITYNNPQCRRLFDLLRPFYLRSVQFLSEGRVSDSHLPYAERLAEHCIIEYLYFLPADSEAALKSDCLLIPFFERTRPEDRAIAARRLVAHATPDNGVDTGTWIKARAFWCWRVETAITAGHTPDFDGEICNLSLLINVAPSDETIERLWPQLIALLPHLKRYNRGNFYWRELEKFVRREVERDSLRAIEYYRMMYDTNTRAPWGSRDIEKEIVQIAVNDASSRRSTIELVDIMIRDGNVNSLEYQKLIDGHVR